MAFENLASRLQDIFKRLRGKGKLTEKDVDEALREVRLSLLEADVNFRVVKDFISKVRERAVGQEVLDSLTPGQQVVKIVYDQLVDIMGGGRSNLSVSPKPPTVLILIGLQGSGKTTTAAKLALFLSKQGKRPLLCACDVYRPAAIKQLQVLGSAIGMPVFSIGENSDPVVIAEKSLSEAAATGRDTVIIDTAGRLQIDDTMMKELERIKGRVNPTEVLLVADAMTGQGAVDVASTFQERIGIDGVILTKTDSDARGGAALSIRKATGVPIKFVGVGEKLEGLEPFLPERMASRILGMGDVLTLIERAQENLDVQKARDLERKLKANEFTLEDFLDQMKQVRKMGPLDQLLSMVPGLGKLKNQISPESAEKDMAHVEAIINSMTREERRNPSIINASRRRRIAKGSGTQVQDVNRLLKQFEQTRQMMKQMSSMRGGKKGKTLPWL